MGREKLQELLNHLLGMFSARTSSSRNEVKILKEVHYLELYYMLFTSCFKQSPNIFDEDFCRQYILTPLIRTTDSLYNCSLISLVL